MTGHFTRFITPALLLGACAVALSACNPANTDTNPMTVEREILTASGDTLGTVTLNDLGEDGTEVTVNITGATGSNMHAMHFHEIGACVAPDFKSAGGHYNPTNKAHGKDAADGPHAGDMMNIQLSDGKGALTVTNDRVSIWGDHGLPALFDGDGSALIIHAGADDYISQPTGAAGARLGCATFMAL